MIRMLPDILWKTIRMDYVVVVDDFSGGRTQSAKAKETKHPSGCDIKLRTCVERSGLWSTKCDGFKYA